MKKYIHLGFLLYIIIDLLFLRERLFTFTLPLTKYLQAHYGYPSFISFNRFMAYLLKPDLCALFNIFYVCATNNKYRAIKSTLYQCVSLYALLFYKNLMNDPRPYFVDPAIKGWECYADFGNPSGHATSVWMFYGIMLTDICKDVKEQYHDKVTKFLINCAFLSLFIFLFVGIVFCRIFLGVHSLNQVMMGTVFGIYIYLVYILYAEHLMEHLFNFIRNPKQNKVIKLGLFAFAYFLFIQAPIAVNKLIEAEVPDVWRENIKQWCQFEEHNMFYKVCFKACSTIGIGFGPIFALILSRKCNHLVLVEFSNKENYKGYKVFTLKNIGKAFLGTVMFIFVFALFYKVYPVSKLFKNIPAIYDKYYSMTLGSFFSTFVLTLFLPKMYGLDVKQRRKSSEIKQAEPAKQTQDCDNVFNHSESQENGKSPKENGKNHQENGNGSKVNGNTPKNGETTPTPVGDKKHD